MIADPKDEAGWRTLLKRLPAVEALEASARASGALRRRRGVKTAAELLRLAIGYGPGGLSLREASAWAGMIGLADISDVAVMKRLRGAAAWLEQLASEVLAHRAALKGGDKMPGRYIRLIDGTTLQAAGSTGVDWRLHVSYDLHDQRFTHIELTDGRGAEKLERTPVARGEIWVADRCYARPGGLRSIVDRGGDYVVRMGARSLKLHHPDGRPFNLSAFLKSCGKRGGDVPILVGRARGRRGWRPLPARLVAIRKPADAAARSRRAAQRASQKHGDRLQPETLAAADYLLLVTALDPTLYSANQIATIYRLRWQIELAFKRLKSLLHIDRLPTKDPDLARSWIYAHLLVALLIEDMTQEFLDSPPCEAPRRPSPLALAHRQALASQSTRRRPRPHSAPACSRSRRTRPISSLRSTPSTITKATP